MPDTGALPTSSGRCLLSSKPVMRAVQCGIWRSRVYASQLALLLMLVVASLTTCILPTSHPKRSSSRSALRPGACPLDTLIIAVGSAATPDITAKRSDGSEVAGARYHTAPTTRCLGIVWDSTGQIDSPGTERKTPVRLPAMICINCSTPIPDDSYFCMACGADVSDPTRATTASLDDAGVVRMVGLLRQETEGESEMDRELGRGGMSAGYLATEIHLTRKVAIKVLPPELTFGDGAIERFRREAQTAAGPERPNPSAHINCARDRLLWTSLWWLTDRASTVSNTMRRSSE